MKNSNERQIRRLAVVLNDSNDAITVQALDGKILAWNRGAEKMYGYTFDEAIKMNISRIVPQDKIDEATKYLKDISNNKLVKSFDTQRVCKNGNIIDVNLTITCLQNNYGVIDSIATTERNITEIKILRGLLPICSLCKEIRDDSGYWHEIETYIKNHAEVDFSHGLCPKCADKLYSNEEWYKKKKAKQNKNT